jgi:hypothetical protein
MLPYPVMIGLAVMVIYLAWQAIESVRAGKPKKPLPEKEEGDKKKGDVAPPKKGFSRWVVFWVVVLLAMAIVLTWGFSTSWGGKSAVQAALNRQTTNPSTVRPPARTFDYRSEDDPIEGNEYKDSPKARAMMIGEDDDSWSFRVYYEVGTPDVKSPQTAESCFLVLKPNKEKRPGRWSRDNPKSGGYVKLKKEQPIVGGYCLEIGNDEAPGAKRDVYLYPR